MKKLLSVCLVVILAVSVCMFGGCGDKFNGSYVEVTDASAKQAIVQKFNAQSTETLEKGAKAAFEVNFSNSTKLGENEVKSTLATSGNLKVTEDKLSTDFKFDMNMAGSKISVNAKAYGEVNETTLNTDLYVNGKSNVEQDGQKQTSEIKSKYTLDFSEILDGLTGGKQLMATSTDGNADIDFEGLFSTAKIYVDESSDGSCKIKLDVTATVKTALEEEGSAVFSGDITVKTAEVYFLLDTEGKITGVKMEINATSAAALLSSSTNTSLYAKFTVFANDISISTPSDLDTYAPATLPILD